MNRGCFVEMAPPHDSCNNRNLRLLDYGGENFVCMGDIDTAACQKQWLLGLLEHFESLFELSHVNTGIWFITADIYALRIFGTSKLCHNILWKVDENRSRTAGSCNIKSFLDNTAEIFTVADSDTVFCDTAGNSNDVNLLECIVSDQVSGNLTCETYKRNTVIVGSSKSGDKVGSTRAACYKTYTDLACGSCVGICLMDKGLLMTGKDDVNPTLSV